MVINIMKKFQDKIIQKLQKMRDDAIEDRINPLFVAKYNSWIEEIINEDVQSIDFKDWLLIESRFLINDIDNYDLYNYMGKLANNIL